MNSTDLITRLVVQTMNTQFLPVGKTNVSLSMLVYMAVLFVILIIVTSKIKKWFENDILAKTPIEPGLRSAFGSLLRYVLWFIGFIVILQSAGFDLSALTVIAGIFGLGLSFGLQTMITNLVAGLIIIFEGPFKVGDRIELDGVAGNVMKISLRATTIVTNDNISIIVPNSELVKGKVTNWSHSSLAAGNAVRFAYPVPVSYDCDPAQVEAVLLAVARAHPGVLAEPAPDVVLQDFTEKSMTYLLRVYTKEFLARPSTLRSEINRAVFDAFQNNELKLAFSKKSE